MAKALINLWAEDGRNIIDDSTDAALTLTNTSTGQALVVENTAGTGNALVVKNTIGAPTVAPLVVQTSTPSGAAIEFRGKAVVSALSGGSFTYGIRVKVGDVYGWVPVMVNMGGLGG